MLRATLAVLLLAAPLAHARDWARAACEDDHDSCRETCTIADGTDLDARGRLERCLNQCQQELQRCQFRRLEARRQKERQVPAPATQVATDAPGSASTSVPRSDAPPVQRGTFTATAASQGPRQDPMTGAGARPPGTAPSSTFGAQSPSTFGSQPSNSYARPSSSFAAQQPAPARSAGLPVGAAPVHPLAGSQPPAQIYAGPPRREVVKAPDYDRLGSGPVESASSKRSIPVASTPSGSDTDALLDGPQPGAATPPAHKPKHKKDLSQWDPADLQ